MTGKDYGELFARGLESGIALSRGKKRREMEEREMQSRELDRVAERKRMELLARQMEADLAAKKEDAARYVEAEAAMSKFGSSVASIDWSSPNARREYEQAVRLHLPTIQRHENVLKKWETFHNTTRQNQAFTDSKLVEMQMDDLRRAALDAGVGVDGVAVDMEVKAGRITPSEGIARLRELVTAKEKEMFERDLTLRKASRRSSTPKLMPGEQAELESVASELEAVNKELASPKLSTDQRSMLVGRKASLQRRLRAFDAKLAAGGGVGDGAEGDAGDGGEPSTPRVGGPSRRRFNPSTGALE